MTSTSIYILVNHGSRNLGNSRSLDILVQEIKKQYNFKQVFLESASLESSQIPLSLQIEQIAFRYQLQGFIQIKILPLFLLPGVHVQHDIPLEISRAKEHLENQVNIELLPYLGSLTGMSSLLEMLFTSISSDWNVNGKRILVAHGSRLIDGNQHCQILARKLDAHLAYWSIEPSIESLASVLISQGTDSIQILPYFLFEGGITQALEQRVKNISIEYPKVKFQMSPALSSQKELATLIAQEIFK